VWLLSLRMCIFCGVFFISELISMVADLLIPFFGIHRVVSINQKYLFS